jgi:hypothetical protein
MLQAYVEHVAERAALGIPPLPLSAKQTADLIELIKAAPAKEEAFLLDLLTNRVPPGVDDAAKVKASFLAAVAHGDLRVAAISKTKATELAYEGKAKATEASASLSRLVGDNAGTIDDKLGAQYGDYARSASRSLHTTAEKLDLILGDARAGKGTLGKILTDETLYNNINQTASNVNQFSSETTKLIYDFRQNPKKYLRIKVSLF